MPPPRTTTPVASRSSPASARLATGAIAQGTYWWDGHPETGLYNHVMPPNTWSCNDSNVNDAAAATASSMHAGGVNVCMCDGSVRFIKQTVSTVSWWAIGSRNGGEVLSADSVLIRGPITGRGQRRNRFSSPHLSPFSAREEG